MASAVEKRRIFYTNMLLLGFDPHNSHATSRIAFNMDMFKVPNKAGFEIVAHFLFDRLNPARAKDEFRVCWPVLDKKIEQTFRRVCNNWLTQISQDEADSNLPKIVPSIFQSPGGDRFCNVMFAFSSYVLTQVIKNEHGVRSRHMLQRPLLTPQNLQFAPAMVQSAQCSVIDNRKKFFDRVQTRSALHRTWQKSASDMLSDYRQLTRSIRDLETDIKSLIACHQEKGFRSPVRLDRGGTRTPYSPASKHGRIFDVNIEAVKREEKVKKVRDLWNIVEGFLASSSDHQEVVGSILSGVVHKYVLSGTDLDVRIPEMLLRECERELLKRDIGNTYKAGKLDLVSVLNLWNLSLHLYLEKFEECSTINLTSQLADLQPKVQTQESQLHWSQELAGSLRDQLIPDLKESVRELKEKYHSKENDHTLTKSKLGMSLQKNTPTVSFNPDLATEADLQSTKMTFTPDMFPQESTPDAVARIMKSVTMKPQRLACSDMTNNSGSPAATPTKFNTTGVSPLAQGKVIRMRRGKSDLNSSSASRDENRTPSSPGIKYSPAPAAAGSVEISRVGSKQVTRVVREIESPRSRWGTKMSSGDGQEDGGVFSSPDMSISEMRDSGVSKSKTSAYELNADTPTSSRPKGDKSKSRSASSRKGSRPSPLEDQNTSTVFSVSESPSDVLAARIAQSIIEEGDVDKASPTIGSSSTRDMSYPYNASNVLDELGVSGFEKKDKLARTPEGDTSRIHLSQSVRSEAKSQSGREIYATPVRHSAVLSESDGEDRIITVHTDETHRSSYSDSSTAGDKNTNNHNLPSHVHSPRNVSKSVLLGTPNATKKSPSTPKSSPLKKSPKPAYRLVVSPSISPTKITTSKSPTAEARSNLSSQSLRDYVSWTPVSKQSPRRGSKTKGRMIVDSVLDEQPLFFDSPTMGDNSAMEGPDADLLDLLPLSTSQTDPFALHGSSGFIPNFREHLPSALGDSSRLVPDTQNGDTNTSGSQAVINKLISLSSTSSDEGESAAKADIAPHQMTMDEIMEKYEQLKNTSLSFSAAPPGGSYRLGGLSPLAEYPSNQRGIRLDESISLQDEVEPDFLDASL